MLTLVIQIRYGYGGFCVVAVATSHLPLPPMKRARSTHGGPLARLASRAGRAPRGGECTSAACSVRNRPSEQPHLHGEAEVPGLSDGGDPGGCSLDAALVDMEAGAGGSEGSDGGGGGGEDDSSGGGGTVAAVAVAVPCACAGSGTLRLRSVMGPADSDNEQQDWTTEEEGSDSADGEAAEGPVEQDRQQRRRTTWRYPSLGRQGNRAPCTAPPLATPSPLRWR